MIELGRYLLEERLGGGSLTEAYRAKSFGVEGFEKTLCVKRLLPNRAEIKSLASGFIDLAQASLSLSHANVAQVIDLGRANASIPGEGSREQVFIATELVEGLDLATLCSKAAAEGVAVPLGVALLVGAEIAKALGHAHRRRSGAVIHGGLTPRSVIVSWEGEVKLTDFAIGRALAMAHFEPDEERLAPYLAPEALHGEVALASSDLYSLGATLFELVTGARPVVAAERARAKAPRPSTLRRDVSPSLEALLERLLSIDPRLRGDDAGSLHEELVAAAYATGTSSSPVDLADFVSRLGRRTAGHRGADGDTALAFGGSTPSPTSVRVSRAEKREATLFVVDGLDALGDRDDARRADLRARVERGGGSIVSADASELRAVFGLVEADGRDAHTAVEVGLELVALFPECGVGVDLSRVTADETGSLVVDGELGPAFAVAAGLAAGGRGKVRLDRSAARAVGAEVELEVDGAHQRAMGPRSDAIPLSRFVGRKVELAAIGRAFKAALEGAPSIAFVVGDRGLGKSRLLSEVALRLSKLPSGVEIARASCPRDLSGAPAPFAAIGGLVRALVGFSEGSVASRELLARGADKSREEGVRKLRALGLDEADVEELTLVALGRRDAASSVDGIEPRAASAFQHVIERLCRDRPLFLAIDDAQYLDAESAAVIESVAREPGRRSMVLFAGRDRPESLTTDIETIALSPLEGDEVALLSAAVLGARVLPPELVKYVDERAQGAPLAIELVLKELADAALVSVRQGSAEVDLERATVPRGLRALVEGRLARLASATESTSAREVLRALAILGPSATLEQAAALVEAPLETVRTALLSHDAASFLEPGRGEPRLSTSLGELVVDTIPLDERKRAHARAAELLAAIDDVSGEHLDRVASHLAAAGEPELAAQRFAEAARAHVRPDLAARSAARALGTARIDALPAATLRDWLATLSRAANRAHARVRLGDRVGAIVDRIDACGNDGDRVAARLDVARLAAIESSFEEAHVVLERARALAVGSELEAKVMGVEVEIAEKSGEIERGCEAALALLARAHAGVGETAPELVLEPRLLLDVASVLSQALDFERAARAIDAAFEGAIAGSAMLRASVEVRRAELSLAAGDAVAAQRSALLGADLAEAYELDYEVARAKIALGAAYRVLGRRERAYAAYVEATEAAEAGGHDRLRAIARAGVTLLEGCLHAGAPSAGAVEALARISKETDARGFAADAIRVRLFWAELLSVRGAKVEATQVLASAAKSATAIRHPALVREIERAREALG